MKLAPEGCVFTGKAQFVVRKPRNVDHTLSEKPVNVFRATDSKPSAS